CRSVRLTVRRRPLRAAASTVKVLGSRDAVGGDRRRVARGDIALMSNTALSTGPAPSVSRQQLRHVVVCGVLAAAAAWLVLLVAPVGGDLAAHLYRTALVRHGILVWDNLWFAGDYPLSSYSLLYYPLAALVGNSGLAIAGVVVAASFFASVVARAWPT